MAKKIYSLLFAFLCINISVMAQSFSSSGPKVFHGQQQYTYDTINVAGLVPQNINGTFGLDSVTFNIRYDYDMDLVIDLISPDGKRVRISENLGWGDSNYTNTCITMATTTLINNVGAPFSGQMRPEGWLGGVNDGQNGNGKWVFKIYNMTNSSDSGVLLNWALHFSSTPAPPAFFDSSTLPIVVVNTANTTPIPFYADARVNGTMGIIYNGPNAVNHVNDPYNNYNGNITIKVRGASTVYFAQKAYSLTTKDPTYANDSNVSILGMPSENDWILYAPFDDKSLIRDVLTYQLSNDMGEYAVRTRMCELVLNGDYRGVYVFEEKIKRDANRVDIAKLNPGDTTGSQLTGGYIFQVDRTGTPGYDSWFSNYLPCDSATSQISFAYVYPKNDDINAPQKNYIAKYVDSFEYALKYLNLLDTLYGYRHYIDVPSFIDFSLLQELGRNVDGYRLSSYFHKKKDGKLYGGPIWDFNEGYGNADYYNGQHYYGFEWNFPCPFPDGALHPFWWKKLISDTSYMTQLTCRYSNLRYLNALDTDHIWNVIDSVVNILQVPQTRHFQRWPLLGIYVWPNAYVGSTYADEISYLKSWITSRISWLDQQWYRTDCLDTASPPPNNIPNFNTANLLKVYPNPASDLLNIASRSIIDRAIIYNAVGQKVCELPAHSATLSIPLRRYGLSAGVYHLMVYSSSGTLQRSFIVDN